MPAQRTPLLRRPLRRPALRHRAQLPALTPALPPPAREAVHDFLVPNPRPDLTTVSRETF